MMVRYRKGDGIGHHRHTLVCRRDDGSQTYAPVAHDLAYHDLMHYAVETVLGCRDAFFGLIAQGWDIEDFTRKDSVTGEYPAMPQQAMQAETLVVLLQSAARDGTPDTQTLAAFEAGCVANGVSVLLLTPKQLAEMRACVQELWLRWDQIPLGTWLELPFPSE